jgi:glycosyltransferase involved in cell wall biosynthesis
MHILMFSMTPLFADKSMGGAQKQLKKVALYLAQQGHRVTILCTRREPDATQEFFWHPNALVKPVYRFKQPFPEPYETPIYNIAHAVQITHDYLAQADAWYSHDGGLIFPYLYTYKPSIVSLRSVLFSETLQSGFLFQGDALILPSQHTAQTWLATVGQFFPDLAQRVRVIHNGLDFAVYHPQVNPQSLIERLRLDPTKYTYVLYPHRPEDGKGIRQTIAVTDLLVNQYGLRRVRVLVPQWIDTGLAPHVRAYYDGLEREIAQRGLRDNFVFHPWVSDDDMPSFYAVGAVTLALGNYVETFGNTPYESLACGTPPIVAKVGAYRDMLPAEMLVDYGDIRTSADRAYHIITQRERVSQTHMAWLHQHFDQQTMVETYADIILNTPKYTPMPYQPRLTDYNTQTFRLAPWCYITADKRVYHDFKGDYVPLAQLGLTPISDSNLFSLASNDAPNSTPSVRDWHKTHLEGYIVSNTV